jgi:hypothetical protein
MYILAILILHPTSNQNISISFLGLCLTVLEQPAPAD